MNYYSTYPSPNYTAPPGDPSASFYYESSPRTTDAAPQWAYIPENGHAQSRDYHHYDDEYHGPPPASPPPPPPTAPSYVAPVPVPYYYATAPLSPPMFTTAPVASATAPIAKHEEDDDPLAIFSQPTPAYQEEQVPPDVVLVSNDSLSTTEDELSNIPADLVAAQQEILDEIRRRNQQEEVSLEVFLTADRLHRAYEQHPHDPSSNSNNNNNNSRALVLAVPRSYNPSGSDAVHPRKQQMKAARPFKTAMGTVGGAVVGGLVTGPAFPVGMLVGGAVGGVATRQACKAGERRAQRKWERSSFQQGTSSSQMMVHMQREGTGIV